MVGVGTCGWLTDAEMGITRARCLVTKRAAGMRSYQLSLTLLDSTALNDVT